MSHKEAYKKLACYANLKRKFPFHFVSISDTVP